MLELPQVVSALIGALIALALQWVTGRWTRALTGKRLSVAFWEELSAVNFYGTEENDPTFAGFTSQTFDTLFREMAVSMPVDLSRALMQYHWRMKWLEEKKLPPGVPGKSWSEADGAFLSEAKEANRTLLLRLNHYSERWTVPVMFRPRETIPGMLLKAVDK